MEYVWVTGTCGTEQKESPAISPEPTGVKTAPASFTHGAPGTELATESTVESGFEVVARHEECSRAGAFGGGSLTLLDRFHHGRVRFMRHPDPSAALGSMEPANTKRSGQQPGCQNPFYHPPQHGTVGEVDQRS
jgi:hypothetical protein